MTYTVKAVKDRDREAWASVLAEHGPDLYRFLRRLVVQASEADELYQELWSQALESVDGYDERRGSLRTWLFGIARNRTAIYWRKRRSLRPGSSSAPEPLDERELLPREALEQLERKQIVEACLLLLTADHRQLLLKKYVDGWTARQLAEERGTTVKAVECTLARIRVEFRQMLAQNIDTTLGTHYE